MEEKWSGRWEGEAESMAHRSQEQTCSQEAWEGRLHLGKEKGEEN